MHVAGDEIEPQPAASPGTEQREKPRDAASGDATFFVVLTRMFSDLPLIGRPLAEVASAPARIRRQLLIIALVFVVYPVFVVAGVFEVINILPQKAQASARQFIWTSIGLSSEEKAELDSANTSIDGSIPMQFVIDGRSRTAWYYESIDAGQKVIFETYQRSDTKGSQDKACLTASPPDEAASVGQMVLVAKPGAYRRTFSVPVAMRDVESIAVIDAEEWDKIKATSDATHFTFEMLFEPSTDVEQTAYIAKCNTMTAYINMTYLKPLLSSAAPK
jgi:hypothetical protein